MQRRSEFCKLILDFISLYPVDKALDKAVFSHVVKLVLLGRKIDTIPTGTGKVQADLMVSGFL